MQPIGPSHHHAMCDVEKCPMSSIDMAPSLFMSFAKSGENVFDYFGSEGAVIAAHRGVARRLGPCKLAIQGWRFRTWYSHISTTVENGQIVEQGDVIGFIEQDRSSANCHCDQIFSKS